MTLAAGMYHLNGLLIFSDTELTAGDAKLHAQKTARWEGACGRVGMVCAGHFANAESTMQHIARALQRLPADAHPYETLETVLDREYRRVVWDNPDHTQIPLDFWIVFAVQPRGEEPELYVSNANTLRMPVSQYACVGSGAFVAEQIIDASGSARATADGAAILASYVLSAGKRNASGVSGKSMMMDFRRDGAIIDLRDDPYLRALEDYFPTYQSDAWKLALTMTQPGLSTEACTDAIDAFETAIIDQRNQLSSLRHNYRVTRDAYLAMTRPREQPSPESTTPDPSGRIPSPE